MNDVGAVSYELGADRQLVLGFDELFTHDVLHFALAHGDNRRQCDAVKRVEDGQAGGVEE